MPRSATEQQDLTLVFMRDVKMFSQSNQKALRSSALRDAEIKHHSYPNESPTGPIALKTKPRHSHFGREEGYLQR